MRAYVGQYLEKILIIWKEHRKKQNWFGENITYPTLPNRADQIIPSHKYLSFRIPAYSNPQIANNKHFPRFSFPEYLLRLELA